jgi:hypothetical protein
MGGHAKRPTIPAILNGRKLSINCQKSSLKEDKSRQPIDSVAVMFLQEANYIGR